MKIAVMDMEGGEEESCIQILEITTNLSRSPLMQEVYARNDYSRVGASALLGVQRPLFFGHGRSKAIAVRNGIGNAVNTITADIVGKIRQAVS